MNQLLLDRMDSLAQDSPHVIANQFEPVPGEKPAAPVPITKLTASTEEEIMQTIKDYADYNLVCNRKIFFKYSTVLEFNFRILKFSQFVRKNSLIRSKSGKNSFFRHQNSQKIFLPISNRFEF